jgi:hypothetical protein
LELIELSSRTEISLVLCLIKKLRGICKLDENDSFPMHFFMRGSKNGQISKFPLKIKSVKRGEKNAQQKKFLT